MKAFKVDRHNLQIPTSYETDKQFSFPIPCFATFSTVNYTSITLYFVFIDLCLSLFMIYLNLKPVAKIHLFNIRDAHSNYFLLKLWRSSVRFTGNAQSLLLERVSK